MPAGRPRKPAKVLELSGAFRKNPSRRKVRALELAIPSGLGEPPIEWVQAASTNHRCQALLNIWNRIVAQDLLHVLNPAHRELVRNHCLLQYKVDRATAGYGKATSGDHANLRANLAAMGMTPVDSPRVLEAVRTAAGGSGAGSGAHGRGDGWGEYVG